jgi:hypothetical protein
MPRGALSHNYAYVADDFDCDSYFGAGRYDEAKRRADDINSIYEAKNTDALDYLREHQISAIVIWPEDKISNDTLEKLKLSFPPPTGTGTAATRTQIRSTRMVASS